MIFWPWFFFQYSFISTQKTVKTYSVRENLYVKIQSGNYLNYKFGIAYLKTKGLLGIQLMDISFPWPQLWAPQPLWLQSSILVSDPKHLTLSIQIGPDPAPYLAQQWALEPTLKCRNFCRFTTEISLKY